MAEGDLNGTANISYTEFLLLAFPGLQESRYLLAIPFFCLYFLILAGNSVLIYTVRADRRLHSPMYILMALLFAVNICGSTVVLPKMLLGFLLGVCHISLAECLAQMFFLYFATMQDCNLLLMMALDRYVAICRPLRYADIMTPKFLVILTVAALGRGVAIVSPVVILASQVRFCRSNIIGHFACEHMALMRLSCGDISRNKVLGLAARTVSTILDFGFLLGSYGCILQVCMHMSSGHARHKAFHTCGTHLLVILTVYSSRITSSLVYRLAKSASQDVHNLISAMYLFTPWILHPVIYGMRTKEIQDSFRKLLRKKWTHLVPGEETAVSRNK